MPHADLPAGPPTPVVSLCLLHPCFLLRMTFPVFTGAHRLRSAAQGVPQHRGVGGAHVPRHGAQAGGADLPLGLPRVQVGRAARQP
jgi:hypothetical protein